MSGGKLIFGALLVGYTLHAVWCLRRLWRNPHAGEARRRVLSSMLIVFGVAALVLDPAGAAFSWLSAAGIAAVVLGIASDVAAYVRRRRHPTPPETL